MRFALEELFAEVPAAQVEQARDFYRARPAGRGPNSFEELAGVRASRATPPAADPPAAEETIGGVPVRILTPAGGPPRGVHLEIHGGGFYMDSAAHGDTPNRRLADSLQVAVVSVDYRLAPEHPWPAAPDDCETVARLLAEEATVAATARFGTSRLTIGGASAGATLAMATLVRLRDRGLAGRFAGAALSFGTYDLSAQTPAGRRIAGEYFLEAYAGHVADRTAADLSPIFADLCGLPPALLVVGADDVLLEDNLAMAGRLSAAGNDVELRVYPAAPHGFTGHPTALARTARTGIESWLHDRLAP